MLLHKNKHYIALVHSLQPHGNGVATVHQKTIILPGTLPDDEVEFKVIKLTKTYAVGKVIKWLKKTEAHCEPICTILKQCGGCHLQHLNYKAQCQHKMDMIQKYLKNTTSTVSNIIKAKNPFYYRNKAQFAFQKNSEGKIVVGLYSINSHRVADTKVCVIQHPLINKTLQHLRVWLDQNPNMSVYDETTGTGELRHVVIRVGVRTDEVMIALVIGHHTFTHETSFIEAFKNITFIKSMLLNTNLLMGNTILGPETRLLFGSSTISDYCSNIHYQISLHSFTQSDPIMAEHLYQYVVKKVVEENPKFVMDLYCGMGILTVLLAEKTERVMGVELSEDSIKSARKNAEKNNVANVEFYQGDVKDIVPTFSQKPDMVIVDPPRKGCDIEVLNYLSNQQIKTLIYISCNPQTLGRDLNHLCQKGYSIKSVQPFDNFAQTAHVECVVILVYI